ncbi:MULTISPECIES: hypothetical protein [unclassified Mesorhizobium]|uniref:hypothetical protein n=1 Tax=unclassified Mesorhizobium TaxID=325217 RepID=UPI000FCBD859|nr:MULTISPECIES: hypothetical protein [unclassified Mesorhizobium]TGP22342.1 hypothetical protein EN874_019725 [Mesorhizobium sp. M1D.F.Ca.ET.231.01.1.1]TGP24688.1 hypothetical protein EN877_30470 [Mesorhizobium sp. M1D.F.Ca.ET.234.01.1.1]TGS37291.1 hypothetical protein EN827_30775 [Mesorhizobium sp. M1D.F.Ca.ET.184.01.1.1]TGS58091.1 hypothetical protein EN826_030750 [Mesorhizobium sp. M1D.F.Ca.ET.183.01.1.1]
MILFRLRKPEPNIELAEEEIAPGSLLDHSSRSVANMLDRFSAEEAEIEQKIVGLTEQLRQVRITITAFEAAGAILTGAKDGVTPIPISTDRKIVGRLVPREVAE